MVPRFISLTVGAGKRLRSLKIFIPGADKLEDKVKNMIRKKGYNLYNHYGPTETTIDVLASRCSQKKVLLGKPITNVVCYILDKYRNLLPIGVIGELYAAGAGVARGYLNRPELTFERFINYKLQNTNYKSQITNKEETFFPHSPHLPYLPHSPIYKTGDLARWLADGNIEFWGRLDHQFKIRGFRVEPGEIESHLLNHETIKHALVIDREDKDSSKSLCAYVVAEKNTRVLNIPVIKNYLSEKLPPYMIPTYVVQLDEIPLTANGKVDRRRLPIPRTTAPEDYIPPQTPIEKEVAKIYSQLLHVEKIGFEQDFFQLGGDSLKVIKLIAKIQEVFHISIPVNQVFLNSRVNQLAKYIIGNHFLKDRDEIGMAFNRENTQNIFCFPPGIGYGISYMEFATLMEDYSLYAFNFIDDAKRLEKYADTIIRVQPQGPYVLLGYSAGGVLCLKTAELLEKKGYEVSDIILMECFIYKGAPGDSFLPPEHFDSLRNSLTAIGADMLIDTAMKKTKSYFEFYCKTNVFKMVHANIHFIRGEHKKDIDEPLGWESLTQKQYLEYNGFGKHKDMLKSPYLEKNTGIVKKILV
jgi:thioesterase domain-containing protein/acyl carrier protein